MRAAPNSSARGQPEYGSRQVGSRQSAVGSQQPCASPMSAYCLLPSAYCLLLSVSPLSLVTAGLYDDCNPGAVAQLGERCNRTAEVESSNLFRSTSPSGRCSSAWDCGPLHFSAFSGRF